MIMKAFIFTFVSARSMISTGPYLGSGTLKSETKMIPDPSLALIGHVGGAFELRETENAMASAGS